MAPHSSTFAWKIPWTGEPGRLQPMGSWESGMTERLHFHFSFLCIGEGNGNPLQCSGLENPREGVAQCRTRLKWLSSSSSILKTYWATCPIFDPGGRRYINSVDRKHYLSSVLEGDINIILTIHIYSLLETNCVWSMCKCYCKVLQERE